MNKKINLKSYNSYGKDEELAALKVLKSRKLSNFLAKYGKNFKGGKNVIKFENQCRKFFKTKYALAVNSWTSGLVAAAGAIDLNPGRSYSYTQYYVCNDYINNALGCNSYFL